MNKNQGISFWILISIAILLSAFFVIGQTTALFNYQFTVDIGLQESVNEVGDVGVAYAKGFGFGDTVVYLPLLFLGIIGLLKNKKWGVLTMFGSLAITAYWPLVCLYAVLIERSAIKLTPDKYISYSIILPLISIYGLWGMWYLWRERVGK
jgi:hypothetical protein